MRALLVEDQPEMARHFSEGLAGEGYAVDVATDGDQAMRLAQSNAYAVLLLDVTMPGKDGFTVVREMRIKNILTPVIFITGRGEVEDRVRGLDAGGDDYLAKPFSLAELRARVRALLRRQQPQGFNVLRVADLELDRMAHRAVRAGVQIDLTNREFALLELLMAATPAPVSKSAIVEHVWHHASGARSNVVNVYLQHLRRKIDRPGLAPLLHTVRGVGFAIHEPAAQSPAVAGESDASAAGSGPAVQAL